MQANAVDSGYLYRSAYDVPHLLNLAIKLFIEGENFLEGGIQNRTLRSKPELLLIPIDNQHFVMRLHSLELLANGRLRYFVQTRRL